MSVSTALPRVSVVVRVKVFESKLTDLQLASSCSLHAAGGGLKIQRTQVLQRSLLLPDATSELERWGPT